MKTFALALCILVLAVTIQDISARPHGRGPHSQRGQGQRGQGQRGLGQRGQGQRGQGQRGQGQRGPRLHGGVCKVLNATTLEVLCNNSYRCPNFTECSPLPAGIPQPPPINDLVLHSCIPKVCNPEDPTTCPPEATCSPVPIGTEARCIPNDRQHRRRIGSSSEESSEESAEEVELDEENEENEEVEENEEDEDTESCREVVRAAMRREVGSRAPGGRGRGRGRHGLKFNTCLLRNTTSNEMLCNSSLSCPASTQCVPTSADDARRPLVESLEIHVCRPMNCTADSSICPPDTTCRPVGPTSWCLPEGRRQGRRDNESCNQILKDILRQTNGRRPFGRHPTAGTGFGQGEAGNNGLGQGEEGNGVFGQGLGRNGGVDEGRRGNGHFGQGQYGPFGIGPFRQSQGPFTQGQMDNGGLGQEPEGNDDLDVEGENSSSSEELPRGNRGNRGNGPSASAFGRRLHGRQP